MSQLFGYSLDRKKAKAPGKGTQPSFVRKESEDAASPIVAGGYFGQTVCGPVGQVVGSAYGRYAGGKMTKKKMSGQAKKKK